MCILDLGVASLVKYCLVFNNSIGGGGGGGGGVAGIPLCRMVPNASLPDALSYLDNMPLYFCRKIFHCLFSMWHKDCRTKYSKEQFTLQKT